MHYIILLRKLWEDFCCASIFSKGVLFVPGKCFANTNTLVSSYRTRCINYLYLFCREFQSDVKNSSTTWSVVSSNNSCVSSDWIFGCSGIFVVFVVFVVVVVFDCSWPGTWIAWTKDEEPGNTGSSTFSPIANCIAFLCSSDGFSRRVLVFPCSCDCHLCGFCESYVLFCSYGERFLFCSYGERFLCSL